MGFMSNLLGGGIVSTVEGIANVINQFVETDDEKRAAELLIAKIAQKPALAQIELNKIEASHRSIFVAGWRPFIGWVCGSGLAIYFIPQYVMAAYVWTISCFIAMDIAASEGIAVILPAYPASPDALMELVIALLGLGALRTAEKFMGKAK